MGIETVAANATKTAVVTGASSRFGAAYAHRLAERGYVPVIVGRKRNRLEAVAADIKDRTGVDSEILTADLGSSSHLEKVEERLRTDESVEMLVNAAGAASFAPSPGFDVAGVEQMVALNVTAATRLTTAALTGMTRRRRGTIVNFSSAMALWFLPVSSVYAASKSYVLTFVQALQQELADSGVRLQVVLPGAMSTGFWEHSGVDLSSFPDGAVMAPEQAVDAALAGLDLGEAVTIPSLANLADWDRYEQARQTLAPILSSSVAADRYRG
jgi:short-subunit dehydrogenase